MDDLLSRLQARRTHWRQLAESAQGMAGAYESVMRDLDLVEAVDAPRRAEIIDPPPATSHRPTPTYLASAVKVLLQRHGPSCMAELESELGVSCRGVLRRLSADEVLRCEEGLWMLADQKAESADVRVLAFIDGHRSGKQVARAMGWPFGAVNEAYKRLRDAGLIVQDSRTGPGRARCRRSVAGDARLADPVVQDALPGPGRSGPTGSRPPNPATPETPPAAPGPPEPRTPAEKIAPAEWVQSAAVSTQRVMRDGGAGRAARPSQATADGEALAVSEGSVRFVGMVDEDLSERFECERRGPMTAQSCHECLTNAHAAEPAGRRGSVAQVAHGEAMPGYDCDQGWRRRFVVGFGQEPTPRQLSRFRAGKEVDL